MKTPTETQKLLAVALASIFFTLGLSKIFSGLEVTPSAPVPISLDAYLDMKGACDKAGGEIRAVRKTWFQEEVVVGAQCVIHGLSVQIVLPK